MASMNRIDLSLPVSAATLNGWLRLVPGFSPESLGRISSYFAGLSGGPFAGRAVVTTGAVQAAGLLTVTSTGPTNGETALVANRTITAVTSGAVPANGEFNINASPTVVATGMALAINSLSTLAHTVTATSALGVVTITAVAGGTIGNGIQLSESMTNVAATAFAGGVDGTVTTVYNGY